MFVLAAEETREIFENVATWEKGLFYGLAVLSTLVFVAGFGRRVRKYRRGRPAYRFDHLPRRISRAVARIYAQATVSRGKRNGIVGVAHGAVMWGFTALLIGTTILAIDTEIVRLFFGEESSFFKGPFYLTYSVLLDVLGLAFVVGVITLGVRRRSKPPTLDYTRAEQPDSGYDRGGMRAGDWLFVGLLLGLGLTGFLGEGLRIRANGFPDFEEWSPVGYTLGKGIEGLGLGAAAASDLQHVNWWVHAVMALGFVALIPFTKAMHLVLDFANLAFTDPGSSRNLPKPAPAPAPSASASDNGASPTMPQPGILTMEDMTWKELLSLDACTKCGRCHEVCPAKASGAPLSPRDLILDLRHWVDSGEGIPAVLDREQRPAAEGPLAPKDTPVAGGVIPSQTLWACTTCMACVEVCPVGIEHVPTIVGMRRQLVDAGDVEPMLQQTLQNFAQQGNSQGKSSRMRARWTKGLDFKIPDARKEPVEYLWFVGDFASFDERSQEASRRVATILHEAGVSFGLLHDGERNAGNDVRRVGEEGLFELLVEQNLAAFDSAEFRSIFTTDPHSLNTLRNEYPEFGEMRPVEHYTELLVRLLDEGVLSIDQPTGVRVTYHDPCYLARYNGVTEAPRRLLAAVGAELVEMPRNGANTFCCGAGGGRIWMDDSKLVERPSEQRIKEAMTLGDLDHFVVTCPKDLSMYSDAAKTVGAPFEVIEITTLLERALLRPEPVAVGGEATAAESESS